MEEIRNELHSFSECDVFNKARLKYVECQNKSGIEIGDLVEILPRNELMESGWNNIWIDSMTKCEGKIGEVKKIYDNGILISIDGNITNNFPFFCLKQVQNFVELDVQIGELSSIITISLEMFNLLKEGHKFTIKSQKYVNRV